MLIVRYYDRDKQEMVSLSIPSDVVAVEIPPLGADGNEAVGNDVVQTAITVNVNTDAVIVDNCVGVRLGMLEYTDLLAEVE